MKYQLGLYGGFCPWRGKNLVGGGGGQECKFVAMLPIISSEGPSPVLFVKFNPYEHVPDM